MNKLNKNETKKYIIKIFDFIENGDSKFNGHPGLYFFHTKEELKEKINELLSENEYDEFDIYYITSLLIKFMLGRYDSHTKVSFKDNVYILKDGRLYYTVKATNPTEAYYKGLSLYQDDNFGDLIETRWDLEHILKGEKYFYKGDFKI